MVLIQVLVEFELLKPCADIDSWGKFHTLWVIFTNWSFHIYLTKYMRKHLYCDYVNKCTF